MFSFHVIHEMGTISKAHEETFPYDDVLYYNWNGNYMHVYLLIFIKLKM